MGEADKRGGEVDSIYGLSPLFLNGLSKLHCERLCIFGIWQPCMTGSEEDIS
jgi:hypothetical protein